MRKTVARQQLYIRAVFFSKAVSDLEKMQHRTLVALLKECAKLTKTNCWWAEFNLARALVPEIRGEMYRREQRKKRKIRAAPRQEPVRD